VYIAQLEGETLTLSEMVLVGLTSMLASMAATSMPSAGLITIVMVLSAIGMPSDKLAVLIPVVRIYNATNSFIIFIGLVS
jgi:Na+/H+-dicarboxylate symporter